MSIFDLSTQAQSYRFFRKFSTFPSNEHQINMSFEGILAAKNASGYFKAKIVKFIDKRLVIYSVILFY